MRTRDVVPRRAGIVPLFLILAFPLFYFVYKYANPEPLAHDFFNYYKMYDGWRWSEVYPPFNMRVVSPYLVYLLSKTGLSYDTLTAFDAFVPHGFDKRI